MELVHIIFGTIILLLVVLVIVLLSKKGPILVSLLMMLPKDARDKVDKRTFARFISCVLANIIVCLAMMWFDLTIMITVYHWFTWLAVGLLITGLTLLVIIGLKNRERWFMVMERDLRLIKPSAKYYQSYLNAIAESESHFQFGNHIFFNPTDKDLFCAINDCELGINLKEGHVPSTYLWFVDGKEFIGMVNIRHQLTQNLFTYGGHIGYVIRYSEWNKGYGSKMLSLALDYCKQNLGIKKVLLTCHVDNIASKKVIESNGGILEDITEVTVDNEVFKIHKYWIIIS